MPHTKYRKSESAFIHAAPDAWNKLLYPIRNIKNADVFKKDSKLTILGKLMPNGSTGFIFSYFGTSLPCLVVCYHLYTINFAFNLAFFFKFESV